MEAGSSTVRDRGVMEEEAKVMELEERVVART